MRFLFIDDNRKMLHAMKKLLDDESDVAFAECHSLDEALEAISLHQPRVIFLDHNLSVDGNEGIKIADRIKGVRIFSTSSDPYVQSEYESRGIQTIDKADTRMFRLVIQQGC